MEEFVKALDLGIQGEQQDGKYVLKIKNSDEYMKVYSLLSLNEDLELDENESYLVEVNGNLVFSNNKYIINLKANFNDDVYSCEINER